jgi:hypothetical protein
MCIRDRQRASQDLSRDYGIDISVKELVDAFRSSTEETISKDIWEELQNTESNEVEKGDFEAVEEIAKKYDKTSPKILAKALKSGKYNRPLIINIGDNYILVAGNTRLCTAAAMGMSPQVFIGKVNIETQDTDINEIKNLKGDQKDMVYGIVNIIKKVVDMDNRKKIANDMIKQFKKENIKFNYEEFLDMCNLGSDTLKGGVSDNKTLVQIAKKHDAKNYYHIDNMVQSLNRQLEIGVKVEMEHVDDEEKAKEIAMDHLWEDPTYYTKLKKMETKEMTGADSAGAFSAPAFGGKKTVVNKIHNMNEEEELDEITDASSSGAYDVPLFGGSKGRKNPLSIGGPDTIYKGRAVKDKKFPKWGGPGGKFVKIKDKCKKYPYCTQGDMSALELLESEEIKSAIEETAKKYGLSTKEVSNLVLNQIKEIFI